MFLVNFFNSIMGLRYCVCSVIMAVIGSNLASLNKIELLIFLSPSNFFQIENYSVHVLCDI